MHNQWLQTLMFTYIRLSFHSASTERSDFEKSPVDFFDTPEQRSTVCMCQWWNETSFAKVIYFSIKFKFRRHQLVNREQGVREAQYLFIRSMEVMIT